MIYPAYHQVDNYAAWASRRMCAPLELLHSLDRHPEMVSSHDTSGAIGINAQEHLLVSDKQSRDTPRQLEWARNARETAGFDATTSLVPGDTENAVAEAVRDMGIEILVMGAHSHSPLRTLFLGRKTSNLLQSDRIPTLLLR